MTQNLDDVLNNKANIQDFVNNQLLPYLSELDHVLRMGYADKNAFSTVKKSLEDIFAIESLEKKNQVQNFFSTIFKNYFKKIFKKFDYLFLKLAGKEMILASGKADSHQELINSLENIDLEILRKKLQELRRLENIMIDFIYNGKDQLDIEDYWIKYQNILEAELLDHEIISTEDCKDFLRNVFNSRGIAQTPLDHQNKVKNLFENFFREIVVYDVDQDPNSKSKKLLYFFLEFLLVFFNNNFKDFGFTVEDLKREFPKISAPRTKNKIDTTTCFPICTTNK
ncbi:hypothetical protein [Holospora elegans]|uniref:hypothetical protein n=1 Tax=Holospora elegans TaxID=431043 RepID=UPI00139239EF|nr:hypothetical protein [Holospora elegans]